MKRLIGTIILQCFLLSCVTSDDIKNAKTKVDVATSEPQNLHPCDVDSLCQNQYNKLLQTAYDLVENNPDKITESLYLAEKNLKDAKVKADECGKCLDRQIVKWTVINKSSIEGYQSSESLSKKYNDNDHKLRMRAYKALCDVSNEPPQ